MGYINGMRTVNCGEIIPFGDINVEALGPSISGHSSNMVVVYAFDGKIKVTMCYDGNLFYVQRFKGAESTQHYWSKTLSKQEVANSNKYKIMGDYCIRAFESLFVIK